MKKFRSLFAIVLTIAIICSFTVISASAATTVDNEADLVTAIAAGGDIVLGDDITINDSLYVDNNVTLTIDLNGYTIAIDPDLYAFYIDSGNLTITDTKGSGKVISTWSSIFIAGGELTINGGTFTAVEANESALYIYTTNFSDTKVTINGGKFITTEKSSTIFYENTGLGHKCEFTINDCEVIASDGNALHIDSVGNDDKITINGGYFSTTKNAIFIKFSSIDENEIIGSDSYYYPAGTFTDADSHRVSAKEIVIEKKTASIKDGADQTIIDFSKGATISSDINYRYFFDGTNIIGEVQVDGKTVDPKNYDHKEGSTVITFKKAYLETLSTGKHEIAIISDIIGTPISAQTTLTIAPDPAPTPTPDPTPTPTPAPTPAPKEDEKVAQTGDSNAIGAFVALSTLSAAGFVSLKKKED